MVLLWFCSAFCKLACDIFPGCHSTFSSQLIYGLARRIKSKRKLAPTAFIFGHIFRLLSYGFPIFAKLSVDVYVLLSLDFS